MNIPTFQLRYPLAIKSSRGVFQKPKIDPCELVQAYLSGLTSRQVAKTFGVEKKTVLKWLHRQGVVRSKRCRRIPVPHQCPFGSQKCNKLTLCCACQIRRTAKPEIDTWETKWKEKCRYYGSKCWHCARPLVYESGWPDSITKDRLKPGSKGGTYVLSNCVPACWGCNSVRGDKPAHEFRRRVRARLSI